MKSSQQKQQQKRQPKKREYEIHLMDFNYASRRGKSESSPPPPWIFDCTHWVPLAGESCCILGGKLNEAEDTRTDPEIELQDFFFFSILGQSSIQFVRISISFHFTLESVASRKIGPSKLNRKQPHICWNHHFPFRICLRTFFQTELHIFFGDFIRNSEFIVLGWTWQMSIASGVSYDKLLPAIWVWAKSFAKTNIFGSSLFIFVDLCKTNNQKSPRLLNLHIVGGSCGGLLIRNLFLVGWDNAKVR